MRHLKRFNEDHNHSSLEVGGLKCDNPNCDWEDMSIPFEDYEKSINKPCPECGDSLLTQDDYDQVVQMIQAVDMINQYSPEDLEKIAANLSEDEINAALDMMNQLKMKKISSDDDDKDVWSIGESNKHLKLFEEFDRDGYQSHWNKFIVWLSKNQFDLYDGEDDLHNKFIEISNDDNLSVDEKAREITRYLEEHWGLYDGYQETLNYLEKLFMDEV